MIRNDVVTAERLLERITNELLHAQHAWDNFLYLFATDVIRIDALNATAGAFFARMQRLMFVDMLLAISRLTDEATVAKKPTASLRQLLVLTGWQQTDRSRWSSMNDVLAKTLAACDPCRKFRHSLLAHTSLTAESLLPATRGMIDVALTSFWNFIDAMRREYQCGSLSRVSDTDESEQLVSAVLNRRSQKQPDLVAVVTYDVGSPIAEMWCGFCGERSPFHFYPGGVPSPAEAAWLHFSGCDGVVGFEDVKLVAVERNDAEPRRMFPLSLRRK